MGTLLSVLSGICVQINYTYELHRLCSDLLVTCSQRGLVPRDQRTMPGNLVDPEEAVDFYRFSSELTSRAVGGTGKWRSPLPKVESGQD